MEAGIAFIMLTIFMLLLAMQGKFATMSMDVDEDEHSIEMHLPFIYKVGILDSVGLGKCVLWC